MDWTSIVVAALACAGTASGSLYGIRKSTSLIDYRLERLETEVKEHNDVIKRTYALEQCVSDCKERIDHLEDR